MLKNNVFAPVVQSPLLTADLCIKCNICTIACPVVAVSDEFLGPKAVGPQAERFRHPRLPIPDGSVSLCSGCGVCSMVCPHGVAIAEMNTQAKARLVEQQGAPVRDQMLARPALLGTLARPFANLINRILSLPMVRRMLESSIGIHHQAPLPQFKGRTFRSIMADRKIDQPPEDVDAQRWVAYFHGCSTNHYEPHLGELAVAIIEALGSNVIIPPQSCCGLPLQSNGLFNAARKYGERNIESLIPFVEAGMPIVGTSTSCTLQLKHELRVVLGFNGRGADQLALATRDFFEWIVEDRWDEFLNIALSPVQGRVLYHAPCQLKSHWIGTPAMQVLRQIPELKLHRSWSECCGIAGTYGVKHEKYQIAHDVGQTLFNQVLELQPRWVLTDSETCRWWIEHHTGVPAKHPLEILAMAMQIKTE